MTHVETNGLSPLEVASCVLFGSDEVQDGAAPAPARSARAALEDSLLRALRQPPCLVGFSGGRDSSALLGCAAQVARREGLPEPVPVTLRFASMPDTQEDEWQALVVRHVGCADWIRREFSDELDLVGPVADSMMRRDGLPYPYNLHLLAPLIEEARGGSFVSGLGGDQALHPAGRGLDVLARRIRPTLRDLARIGVDLGPRAVRRRLLKSRVGLTFPWLRNDANLRLSSAWLEDHIRRPFRWSERLMELWRARFLRLTVRRLAALGERSQAVVHHPFAERDFVVTLARQAGATGFANRTVAMHELFADVLPDDVIARPTKASFNDVLWNRHTRSFVEQLREDELEHALAQLELDAIVDPRALTEHWAGPAPMANSFLLLQACYLALR